MIIILFQPYEDEFLFCWWSRNHHYSGLSEWQSRLEIFGKRSYQGIHYLGDLDFYLKETGLQFGLTAKYLKDNHSLFPLYRPFMPETKLEKITKGNKKLSNKDLGFTGFRGLTLEKIIKVCPICFENELYVYGEAYIHREFQVAGNNACDKHGVYLKKVDFDGNSFIDLSNVGSKDLVDIYYDKRNLDTYLRIAKEVRYLLELNICELNNNKFRNKYISKLRQNKNYRSGKRLNWKNIKKDFVDYYSEDFLIDIESTVDNSKSITWLEKMMYANVFTHPIRHILFIIFLFGSVQSILQYEVENHKPFGEGPWPCLNKNSAHYLEKTVKNCEIQYTSKKQKHYTGIFKCEECGFTYRRKGPDESIDDKFKYSSIVSFGQHWIERVIQFKSEGFTFAEIARTLSCDQKTVKKHYLANCDKK